MKKYVKKFCIRGLMFTWGGPVIVAIVWLALQSAGVMTSLTVNEAAFGIISSAVMAFIAAGVSIVYDIESLPKAFAGLIQMAVLYVDYLGCYLLNGWMPAYAILTFTIIFAAIFIVIWLGIYIPIRMKVNKMNKLMNKK